VMGEGERGGAEGEGIEVAWVLCSRCDSKGLYVSWNMCEVTSTDRRLPALQVAA
jgi:hypothetical protein